MVQIREGWIGSDKRRVFIVLEGMTITYMESCGGYLWFVMAISTFTKKIKGQQKNSKKIYKRFKHSTFRSSHGNFPPLTHLHIFA